MKIRAHLQTVENTLMTRSTRNNEEVTHLSKRSGVFQCVEGSSEQLGCHDGASKCSRTLLLIQGCEDVEVAL